jgi:hypothetical protein
MKPFYFRLGLLHYTVYPSTSPSGTTTPFTFLVLKEIETEILVCPLHALTSTMFLKLKWNLKTYDGRYEHSMIYDHPRAPSVLQMCEMA